MVIRRAERQARESASKKAGGGDGGGGGSDGKGGDGKGSHGGGGRRSKHAGRMSSRRKKYRRNEFQQMQQQEVRYFSKRIVDLLTPNEPGSWCRVVRVVAERVSGECVATCFCLPNESDAGWTCTPRRRRADCCGVRALSRICGAAASSENRVFARFVVEPTCTRRRGGGYSSPRAWFLLWPRPPVFVLAVVFLALALPKGLDGGESVLTKSRRSGVLR